MIPELDKLDDREIELVLKAPVLVCILIAGADGEIDRKEIKEAILVVQRQKSRDNVLSGYFSDLAEDFEDKIKIMIQSYPYESTQRTPLVISDLAELNRIWVKLNKDFAIAYYGMLKSLAEKVALSSGGIWGMRTVAAEEAKYMSLPMLSNPEHL